jgi:heptosyltransferase-2
VTALARRLSDGGSQVLLIGGGDDRGRAQALAAASGAITTAGNSVREALAELSLCQGSVGLDSGLSHASVALGVPTVLLFGPNDPRSILPAPNQRILSLGLACQPCNRRGKTGCPLGHHGCMAKLSADQIFDALARLRTASAA